MPYKSGKLKGEMTSAELRRLVRSHNKLMSITIPPKTDRDGILALIQKNGYDVDHKGQKLVPRVKMKRKPVVPLPPPPPKKTAEEKAEAKKTRAKKKEMAEESAFESRKRKIEAIKKVRATRRPMTDSDILKNYGGYSVKELNEILDSMKGVNSKGGGSKVSKIRKILDNKGTLKKKEPVQMLADKPKKVAKPFKVSSDRGKLNRDFKTKYKKTIYQVLGVNARISPEDMKQRARELRRKTHPDKGGDRNEFAKVNEAIEIMLKTYA